jgi:hypothetical protein
MSTSETLQQWTTTNPGNANSDSAISSSDTQAPNTVATNIRSIMTALAKYRLDGNGGLTAGGTADALTVTSNQVLQSSQLTAGLALLVAAASANTSATVTFAPDGLTAAAIKRADGSALAVGSITAGMKLCLVYNSGTSEWWCANILPTGPGLASFSATMSAVQTGIVSVTDTKILYDTSVFDVGSHFSSNTWTPPAGTCLISAGWTTSSGNITGIQQIKIFKNGSNYKSRYASLNNSTNCAAEITIIDQCNGTDTYAVYANIQTTSGTVSLGGSNQATYFMGSML